VIIWKSATDVAGRISNQLLWCYILEARTPVRTMKASLRNKLILISAFAIPAASWFIEDVLWGAKEFRLADADKLEGTNGPLWAYLVESVIVGSVCMLVAYCVISLIAKFRQKKS
jgi:hypothetical protein